MLVPLDITAEADGTPGDCHTQYLILCPDVINGTSEAKVDLDNAANLAYKRVDNSRQLNVAVERENVSRRACDVTKNFFIDIPDADRRDTSVGLSLSEFLGVSDWVTTEVVTAVRNQHDFVWLSREERAVRVTCDDPGADRRRAVSPIAFDSVLHQLVELQELGGVPGCDGVGDAAELQGEVLVHETMDVFEGVEGRGDVLGENRGVPEVIPRYGATPVDSEANICGLLACAKRAGIASWVSLESVINTRQRHPRHRDGE